MVVNQVNLFLNGAALKWVALFETGQVTDWMVTYIHYIGCQYCSHIVLSLILISMSLHIHCCYGDIFTC